MCISPDSCQSGTFHGFSYYDDILWFNMPVFSLYIQPRLDLLSSVQWFSETMEHKLLPTVQTLIQKGLCVNVPACIIAISCRPSPPGPHEETDSPHWCIHVSSSLEGYITVYIETARVGSDCVPLCLSYWVSIHTLTQCRCASVF